MGIQITKHNKNINCIDSNLKNFQKDEEKELNNKENKINFSFGKNLSKINENNKISISKLTYGFIKNELVNVVDNHL